MVTTIIYFILAALGLSFLVFIHELGHYFVARRNKMRVEVFSIGFGKPIYQWTVGGVQWQVCYLLFGGYVKIVGMERQDNVEPHQIPDGFYAKKPSARIKVALAGPIVNILFAFLCFTLIWGLGGRKKPFSEFTKYIGWVAPYSEAQRNGIRPGDEILSINGNQFTGFKDLIYNAIVKSDKTTIQGLKIDHTLNQKNPFSLSVGSGKDQSPQVRIQEIGILAPANYLIYNQSRDENLYPSAPIVQSGIKKGDRIIWVDGEIVFSSMQLMTLINQPVSLLTIQRGDQIFLERVPRVKIRDLKSSREQKSELDDWQHAANLKGDINTKYFIPYDVNPDLMIERELTYIDEQSQERLPSENKLFLQSGDRIIAVDGKFVADSSQFFAKMQSREIQLIVKNARPVSKLPSWIQADEVFENSVNWQQLNTLIKSVGVPQGKRSLGDLTILKPIRPIPLEQFPTQPKQLKQIMEQFQKQREEIEKIDDQEKKNAALTKLEQEKTRLMLGFSPKDRLVRYNPSPIQLFENVLQETWWTISSLVRGNLSPKYLAGPVGIVHVMQQGWSTGVREALYWLALISLNLGIINLLPLPVLDGGHICFSLYEIVTKKRIKAKTMEKMIIPFVVLIIFFFLYITYHDILRLLERFF